MCIILSRTTDIYSVIVKVLSFNFNDRRKCEKMPKHFQNGDFVFTIGVVEKVLILHTVARAS